MELIFERIGTAKKKPRRFFSSDEIYTVRITEPTPQFFGWIVDKQGEKMQEYDILETTIDVSTEIGIQIEMKIVGPGLVRLMEEFPDQFKAGKGFTALSRRFFDLNVRDFYEGAF